MKLAFGLVLAISLVGRPSKEACEAQVRTDRTARLRSKSPRLLGPMAISDDAATLILSISDEQLSHLRALTISSGKVLWDKELDSPVKALALSVKANEVAVGFRERSCWEQSLLRFQLQSGVEITPTLQGHGELSDLRSDSVDAIGYSGDGKKVAAALGGEVRVWDLKTGSNISIIEPPGFNRRKGIERVEDIEINKDGSLVAGAGEMAALLWRRGKLERSFGHFEADSVRSVLLSPDERVLAIQADSGSAVYAIATGKKLASFPSSFSPVRFLANDDLVVSVPDGVRTWSGRSKTLGALTPTRARSVFVLGDGRILGASGDINQLTVLNVRTGKDLITVQLPERPKH